MNKKEIINFLLIPILIVVTFEQYFCISNFGLSLTVQKGIAFVLSILLYYLFFFIFWGLTKKTNKSILAISIILFVFSVINSIKIAYTGEPITFSDILYLKNSDELIGIVGETLYQMISNYIYMVIIYLACLIVINLLAFKNSIEVHNTKIRLNLIIIPIIILVLFSLPLETTKKVMFKYVYNVEGRKDYEAKISNLGYYSDYGVVLGMYGQMLENRISKPESYNEEDIKKEINVKNEEAKEFGSPNIITILSESFWDISKINEVKFDKDITSNFNLLKDKGKCFEMVSPSYGGITANVEFEFLTGANLMYFNYGYVPTMQLYRNKTYYNRPSIISELKNNGYKTEIVTYTSNRLFSRGNFYKYLGVDTAEFITDVNENEIKGKYISDKSVIDRIIYKMNSKTDEEKLFYMAMTLESHMPYKKDKYDNYDIQITQSSLSEEMNGTIISYAQGVYDADQQLGRLYEYIQTINEPTIIVFFGDHLPYLNTEDGQDILQKLQYFNTEDELLNTYRKYSTEALILANFDINKEKGYLGADLLGTYVLNKMDINISDYYKWLYTTKDEISGANWKITVDKQGEIYNTNLLEDKMKKAYELRRNIQYKYFIK